MANGLMVTNTNWEIVLYNPALLRLLGINEEVRGPIPITQVIDDQRFMETLRKIHSGEPLESEMVSQEISVGDRVLRAISALRLSRTEAFFGLWQAL